MLSCASAAKLDAHGVVQAYPHKILTGRRSRMPTIRQTGGMSGFTNRAESEYDPFGAGHSSTSISAALGMAVARDFKVRNRMHVYFPSN